MPVLEKPQVPRPQPAVAGSTWASIWTAFSTVQTGIEKSRQYLQTYLTKIYNQIIPAKYIVSIVLPPYAVNTTDAFIAATGGAITLPQSSGSGRVIIVKNVDAAGGVVMVLPQGTDTIDGGASTSITLANDAIRLIDGAPGTWYLW